MFCEKWECYRNSNSEFLFEECVSIRITHWLLENRKKVIGHGAIFKIQDHFDIPENIKHGKFKRHSFGGFPRIQYISNKTFFVVESMNNDISNSNFYRFIPYTWINIHLFISTTILQGFNLVSVFL